MTAKSSQDSSVSLCLVLDNPFSDPPSTAHVPEALLERRDASPPGLVQAYLHDDALLLVHPDEVASGLVGSLVKKVAIVNSFAAQKKQCEPTKFQKIIDIILRLQAKHFTLDPPSMLRRKDNEDGSGQLPNEFAGWVLQKEALFVSQSGEEMYIRITATNELLLEFAAKEGVYMRTHPYSFAGGAPMTYTSSLDMLLRDSVESFLTAFPETSPSAALHLSTVSGFIVQHPDRCRLMLRMVREGWKFGGCGIQIQEMKKASNTVRQLFPLHDEQHSQRLNLPKWASLKQVFSSAPLFYEESNVVEYFGEEIGLYFSWLVSYTKSLTTIAVVGLVCGIFGTVGDALHKSTTLSVTTNCTELRCSTSVCTTRGNAGVCNTTEYLAGNASYNSTTVATIDPFSNLQIISNSVFAAVCVLWGILWNVHWLRREKGFAIEYGQDVQMTQELVRDEFEPDGDPVPIAVHDIYHMGFDVPLTLKRLADGTLVNLVSNNFRRLLIRYCLAYPVILLVAAAMVVTMSLQTWWRFSNPQDDFVSYASSVLSLVTSAVFSNVFEVCATKFNAMENNRTDTEESRQYIGKSFLFSFFSKYFTVLSIMLWPSDATSGSLITDSDRMLQLRAQMLIICCVKPMTQNLQEIAKPYLQTELRVRASLHEGSTMAALASLLKREQVDTAVRRDPSASPDKRRDVLWLQAQLEPYESTSGDYLEITLQYGYMTMFAATFPWAAVAALLYNIIELRVDAWKLLNFHQRPQPRPTNSIGAWNAVCFFILSVSIATNGYLVSVISDFQVATKIETANSDEAKYKAFAATQYVFLALIFAVFAFSSKSSLRMQRIATRQSVLSNYSTRKKIEENIERAARRATGNTSSVLSHSQVNAMLLDNDAV